MNTLEEMVRQEFEAKGFTVLKKGWPDFMVIDENNNAAFTVEVKSSIDSLSPEQIRMHECLHRLGVRTYINKDGFIEAWTHRRPKSPFRPLIILTYVELSEALKVDPKTFRKQWKHLPHFFVGIGSNLKSARFILQDVLAFLSVKRKNEPAK